MWYRCISAPSRLEALGLTYLRWGRFPGQRPIGRFRLFFAPPTSALRRRLRVLATRPKGSHAPTMLLTVTVSRGTGGYPPRSLLILGHTPIPTLWWLEAFTFSPEGSQLSRSGGGRLQTAGSLQLVCDLLLSIPGKVVRLFTGASNGRSNETR